MTVFSYSYLVLIIDGNRFTAKYLSGVTITKSGGGIGTSGVTTTCLTGRVKTDFAFNLNAEITVIYKNWEFPQYYIDTSDFNGYSVNLTAYDLSKDLDLPFDRSGYKKPATAAENRFLTSMVISDIAQQIGFSGCDNTSLKTYLKYK